MSNMFALLRAAFHESETDSFRCVQGVVWGLILTSILLLVVETFLPDGSPLLLWLEQADRLLLSVFALEILLRVLTFRPPELEGCMAPLLLLQRGGRLVVRRCGC